MKSVAAALIILVSQASATAKPAWETYNKLLCRDEKYVACQRDWQQCSTSNGEAMFEFDFQTSSFRSMASQRPGRIVAREHDSSVGLDQGTVFLSWGMVVTFLPTTFSEVPGKSPRIDAISQSAAGKLTSTRFMTCWPA